jgi:hypothetical protein
MGWTGRAPAPNRSESERGLKSIEERTVMPFKTDAATVRTIGIDTGKTRCGLDEKGYNRCGKRSLTAGSPHDL